jgi:rSAM/selenodomain-associated transferase 1
MNLAADPAPFHIVVFARAPVAGRAKTRLVPLLGATGAAAAQRWMALRTLQVACAAAPAEVSLWVADTPDDPFFLECAERFGLVCEVQCAGDLGRRMANCLQRQLAHSARVLLIGTDCPAWTGAALAAAAQALADGAHMVWTPAEDGGYVLVGARRGVTVPQQVFQGIDWGSAQVMAQTRTQLARLGWQRAREWCEMPALWDVDTPEDYLRAESAGLLAPRLLDE